MRQPQYFKAGNYSIKNLWYGSLRVVGIGSLTHVLRAKELQDKTLSQVT